ncbi:S41 family peptidase [Methylotenera sp.]|jgi:carboxyl-terminal processing protease|uniref:S41 family peptidase n=1 Tax=Methylotenera sp. TaxID=2051956 RepID=UPI00271ADA89|nr:S41 family peptidase [Methylotenera sp.]MDO9206262.1 S41 family peptidase [Methylotenera sp.]MDP2153209.1 S41 family peptidase [Methylotenera sp.]
MQVNNKQHRFTKIGLVGSGLILGLMLSLTYSAVAEKMVKPQLPLDDLRAFAEVFGKIKTDYVETVEDKKLISEAISGMLTGLDPHSTYMDPDAFKDMQVATQGEFGGLGIEVGMEDGLVKVISPIEDSPAYTAGLKSGDLIVKLDDTPVKGMTLNDAVKRMRGKPDTQIVLTVVRKTETKPLKFTLTRAIIKSKSVKYKLTEPGYAYARVTQFQERTGEDLAKAIKTMHDENKGAFKGFILDLRNDPGGLLNGAVGVSAAFLPKGELVVYTEGRAPDSKMQLTAVPENYVRGGAANDYIRDLPADLKTVPMVVLINSGSASASEIVAGALQDHKRAAVLGTQSFGKGSVQTIMPMNNGAAIKLTTARYFTPKGRSIQAKGIVPDYIVEDGTDQSGAIHEADLSRHLSNPKDGEAKKPADTTNAAKEAAKEKLNEKKFAEPSAPIEPASKDDIQFIQAMNLLKGLPVIQSTPVVKAETPKTE